MDSTPLDKRKREIHAHLDNYPTEDSKDIIRSLLKMKLLRYVPDLEGDKATLEVIFGPADQENDENYRTRLERAQNFAKILASCGVEPISYNARQKIKSQLGEGTRNLAQNLKIYNYIDIIDLMHLLKIDSVLEIITITSDIITNEIADDEQ